MCTCKECNALNCLCNCHRAYLRCGVEKSRDQKEEELIDKYSNDLFDMDDEKLDQEYNDKIGEI